MRESARREQEEMKCNKAHGPIGPELAKLGQILLETRVYSLFSTSLLSRPFKAAFSQGFEQTPNLRSESGGSGGAGRGYLLPVLKKHPTRHPVNNCQSCGKMIRRGKK